MLPWLNLCVQNIGPLSLVSVQEYELQNSKFRLSDNLNMEIGLTDFVVLKNNHLTEYWVLPQAKKDPIQIPVDIVPPGFTHHY